MLTVLSVLQYYAKWLIITPVFIILSLPGRGGSATPPPCWTGRSCSWAATTTPGRSPGRSWPLVFTVETMSLPSVATLALDTWSQVDGPAIGPLRVVAAVGVAVPAANALAVGIASVLTGTATSSRGKVGKRISSKTIPFAFFLSWCCLWPCSRCDWRLRHSRRRQRGWKKREKLTDFLKPLLQVIVIGGGDGEVHPVHGHVSRFYILGIIYHPYSLNMRSRIIQQIFTAFVQVWSHRIPHLSPRSSGSVGSKNSSCLHRLPSLEKASRAGSLVFRRHLPVLFLFNNIFVG